MTMEVPERKHTHTHLCTPELLTKSRWFLFLVINPESDAFGCLS